MGRATWVPDMTCSWRIYQAALVCMVAASLAYAYVVPTGKLTCFSRPLGEETKTCEMIHGFRSCYTKYNMRGQVMARGCSTLQPTFNKCDTNKYGQFKSDKYCYCKKSYCNNSTKNLPNIYCLVILYSVYLFYTNVTNCGQFLGQAWASTTSR